MFFTPTAFYKNSTPTQQVQFAFDADYIMLTYEFTDGIDLDTKTRIVTPDIGQTTNEDFVGYPNGNLSYPLNSTPIITWGDDNRDTGFESVLINVKQLRLFAPTAQSFVLDARALWFVPGVIGSNDVNIAVTLWRNPSGGAPVKNGCINENDGLPYCWTNSTAVSASLNSVGVKIINNDPSSIGQRAATLTYNLQTHIGTLNSNDTTTPIPTP